MEMALSRVEIPPEARPRIHAASRSDQTPRIETTAEGLRIRIIFSRKEHPAALRLVE
jgi:hypothetical protein